MKMRKKFAHCEQSRKESIRQHLNEVEALRTDVYPDELQKIRRYDMIQKSTHEIKNKA